MERKINLYLVNALANNKEFKQSNTQVIKDFNGILSVWLHGNNIATINPEKKVLNVTSCGWKTQTTKSRLNAILNYYIGATIKQQTFDWFVLNNNKKIAFTDNMEFKY